MSHKLTNEECLKRIQKVHGDSITVLSDYVDNKTKIHCRCNICQREWWAAPNNLFYGKGCFVCKNREAGLIKRKGDADFRNELAELHPSVLPPEPYNGACSKITFRCMECGHEWRTQPHSILRSKGCPACSYKRAGKSGRKTHQTFVREVAAVNPTIEILGQYELSRVPILTKCRICGLEWEALPVTLWAGQGCPHCCLSKGELKISTVLDSASIPYIQQYSYDDLRGLGGRKLSYDFFLPDHNLLIEYQGEYHDHTASIQTDEGFRKQQEHDTRKRAYAAEHGIGLLEIWYYDYDKIEDIIRDVLQNPVTSKV